MIAPPYHDDVHVGAAGFLWGATDALSSDHAPESPALEQEINLLTGLGLNAYRLSIDWAHVEPRPGAWDYTYLTGMRTRVLNLRYAGIEPILTLHRGLDPAWFLADDGWLRGDAVQLFCRFVVKVVEELGDLITFYVTVDGPVRLAMGDVRPNGRAAPTGKASAPFPFSMWATWRRLRALIHAHGAARRTLRAATPRHGPWPSGAPLAGFAHHMTIVRPHLAASALDRAASSALDYTLNWLPLRILTDGRLYAPLGHGQSLPELRDSLDFIGVTVAPYIVADAASLSLGINPSPPPAVVEAPSFDHLLRRVAVFAKPVVVTGDGSRDPEDAHRGYFLQRRLAVIAASRQRGVPLRGYLYTPLIDPASPSEAVGYGLAERGNLDEPPRARPSATLLAREIQARNLARYASGG